MSPIKNLVLLLLAAQSITAHFLLHYPSTVGFDDDNEVDAPCGGFSVDFSSDNVTDFHVDSDVIAVESIHPQATWLFRATLDTTASSNWTSLLPAILQTDLGDYCEKGINIPSSWVGQKGVIGVVQDAPDGILYQCAAVNFVAGSSNSTPSSCTNVTGLTATYTLDAKLSSLPASSTPTSTSSSTSTSTKSAAAGLLKPMEFGAVGAAAWVVLVGGMTMAIALL